MESPRKKLRPSISATPITIEDPIHREIERLSAQARELVALAIELHKLQAQITQLIVAAVQLSGEAAEMKRNTKRFKGQRSVSLN